YVDGDIPQALMHLERALELSEQLPLKHSQATLYNYNLGKILQLDGQFERAITHFERAHTLAKESERVTLQMAALQGLAIARMEQGELASALTLQADVLTHWEHHTDPMRLMRALMVRGDILNKLGDAGAEEDYKRALDIANEIFNTPAQQDLEERMIGLLEAQERLEEACSAYARLRELEQATFETHRSAQYQKLKAKHEFEQKRREAELYRERAELLEREVARRTQELEVRNAELAAARDLAEAASRTKSTFLGMTSHELRTPLNAIIGYSEILLEELEELPDADSMLEDLSRVRHAAMHLFGLIDKVLQLSNLEAGTDQITSALCHPSQLLTSLAQRLQGQADRQGSTLLLKLHDSLPAREPMHTDAQRLQEVVGHLVDNAIKFTDAGTITLRARRVDERLEIAVEDEGIGLDEETMSKLFEPFEQQDLSYTRLYEGLGLGLTLCHHHVKLLGGELTAAGREEGGSVFTIHLPWTHPTAPE
ncbi:MAG: tetratricopeptide repeat-containing sensor histidine kinase, partial [Myxococcota bacterium]